MIPLDLRAILKDGLKRLFGPLLSNTLLDGEFFIGVEDSIGILRNISPTRTNGSFEQTHRVSDISHDDTLQELREAVIVPVRRIPTLVFLGLVFKLFQLDEFGFDLGKHVLDDDLSRSM